ncbi:hypothetical protein B5M09_010825 [Aphanomyces astaci]|uniref:FYVE-type domain-containing protein n=1 Tax=Aphanomyces astaci TaxID=112090 RepID=A0A3R7WEW6_APHAT|nr:hypothetical protein B5M09_010825 [Aphanomyces astaci]
MVEKSIANGQTMQQRGGGCTIYKGFDPTAPPGVMSYLVTMELEATLAQVAAMFAAYTPHELHEYRRRVAQDVIDIHQLYALATPTPDFPHRLVSIKYFLMKGAMPAITRPRDFCCLDFEINGVRGFARAMRSIELPCVPDFEASFNIVRGYEHRGGFVFIESSTTPGVLCAAQLHQVDPKGKLPTWLVDLGMKIRCRSFHALARLVNESRMTDQAFLRDHEVVAKASRSHCALCLSRFRVLFKPPARCRKCGEVMCHQCAPLWSVRTSHGQVRRVRVCQMCCRNSQPLQSSSRGPTEMTVVDEIGPEESEDSDAAINMLTPARWSFDEAEVAATATMMQSLASSADRF